MTKDELWMIYVSKNPQFETGPVTFTATGLRKFFDQTFAAGANSTKRCDKLDFITDFFNKI